MAVTVSGMFGSGKTFFADSPVVIDISGLEWPGTSPFNIVRVEVYQADRLVGTFKGDTGGQAEISFDISSALRVIWSDYGYAKEVAAANSAKASASTNISYTAVSDSVDFFSDNPGVRKYREYSLRIYTEYLAGDDGGVYTETICTDEHGNTTITGGRCAVGSLTEWERYMITDKADADVSHWEHTGVRNGDASTKPTSSPECVGSQSITSWVDVSNGGTKSIFYPSTYNNGQGNSDDVPGSASGWTGHAPLVLRDTQPYVDFLFINRRGAIETCSGLTKESMDIDVQVQQYARVERPSFKPSRSLMAIGTDGRRSWQMSSGYVTREWAEWWTMEFLGGKRKQWWMRYPIGDANGQYVPVVVKPAKNSTSIYDRSKQQMPHVDFTVTLALEG